MVVYVVNKHGKPLMPCSPRKAGKLLKEKKAEVVRKDPFTIQLLFGSYGYKQEITLGIDAGSRHIGLSAGTDKQELFSADVELRNDISDLISDKAMYRRAGRNRLRYRKARFLNRVGSKNKGWLAPSVEHKIQTHLSISGDGKIDKKSEMIGTVLCRTTHDERVSLESLWEQGESKGDAKITIHYSFMAPDADLQKGLKYFNLCGYIESMMPDQVNRGFGKHSMLGYINQQRSDIILFKDMSIENMSRALTEESTLVAVYDIVRALIAAKRPYSKDVAAAFGIADQFAGNDFQASNQLAEKRDWGMMIGLVSVLILLALYKTCGF